MFSQYLLLKGVSYSREAVAKACLCPTGVQSLQRVKESSFRAYSAKRLNAERETMQPPSTSLSSILPLKPIPDSNSSRLSS